VPDPVECFDDCECSEDGYSCTTFKAGALEGGKYGFHGYHADGKLVPCKLCEGTGEYVPEVEEDFCEPDTDDDF